MSCASISLLYDSTDAFYNVIAPLALDLLVPETSAEASMPIAVHMMAWSPDLPQTEAATKKSFAYR